MKRKPIEGEIIVTDWDLMGEWYDPLCNGEYIAYTLNGRVGYVSVRNSENDSVVLSYPVCNPNGIYIVERWLKRGQKVRLVPTGKPE